MKLINKFLLLAVFICTAGFLNAQTAQMPKWPINGKEVDFIGQQVNNTNASLSEPKYVSNGYYDRDNNLLFHIIDNNLWWGGGTYAGPLFEDVDPVDFDDRIYPEIVVVPTDTLFCEDGSFYAFYCVERNEDPLGKLLSCSISDVSVMYSVITPNSSGTGTYSTSNNLLTLGRTSVCKGVMIGIAATDFLPGTNTRRLYVVYFDRETLMSEIKFYTISPTAISGPYSVGSKYDWNNPFEPCEVEISSDRSKLVFTRNKYYQNTLNTNTNDVTIVHLLSTGYRNTAAGSNGYTYVDLGPANSTTDYYVGVEFSADLADLYVTRVGDGLYRYNLNTQVITDYNTSTLPIANSQLEMGRDGYIYGMSGSGQLYTIDQYGAFAQGQYNIGTTGVIDNDIFSDLGPTRDVYTIPDQIDGYDYDGLWGNAEVCCETWTVSPIVRPTFTGVTFNGDDISINAGASVSWSTTSNPWTTAGVAITNVYLKGSITIPPTSTLTITGLTIHFKEDEGIDMSYTLTTGQKGSKLNVVSNAKLTAFDECEEDVLWGGINCVGHESLSQTPYTNSQQPYVNIAVATIEFAEIGIDAPNGGIVRTSSVNFKDNIIDVSFSGNNNYDQTVLLNSDFYTTADLYNKGFNPSYHAHLYNGSGVIFKGCDFYNNYAYQNSISYNYWGVGILATLSNIIVEENGTTKGNFSHLNYGLKLSQGTSFTLTQHNFNDCYRSAWIIANNGVSVTECDFDVSAYTESQTYFNYIFGLYLESCTGYYVSENTFRDGRVGLIVYNSNGANQQLDNEIYKNTFQDLTGTYTSSFIGIGDNSGWPSYKKNGLQLKCNIFDNVSYSISVLGGSLYTSTSSQPITVSISDIKQYQCYNTVSENASNFWQNMPSGNFRYIYIDPSYSQTLSYEDYIYNCTNATGYYPPWWSYDANYVQLKVVTATTCPSTLSLMAQTSIPSLVSQTQDYSEFENHLIEELSTLTSYNDLSLSISAQSANENNATEVYNSLYSASPYLTSEILLAYLNNSSVPELSRASLMLANSPLPTDVVEAVEKSDLSPEIIAYILKNQEGVNEIEQLQNQISGVKSARQVNYDHLMRATFNADTTAAFAETFNYVMDFMETQTDFHAKNRLVDMYIKKGMFDNALAILGEMEQIAITSENTGALNDIELTEIKIDILQNLHTESIQDVVKRHEDFLTEMAADYNTKEGGVARAILESAGLMENFPIVFLPNPEDEVSTRSALISEPEQESVLNTELKSLFKLYPNPANDYLAVEFINPDGACSFNIYSIKGELVKTVSSNQQLGFISINISDLQPGQYVINCPELQSKMNFVIVR